MCCSYIDDGKLRPPKSDDEWKKANVLFETDLVPRVLSESSVDSKCTVLAEGVYTYFETVYGSVKVRHQHRKRQSKRQSKLAQHVKEAKALKSEARCEFLQARKSTTLFQEQVCSIAK